MPADMADQSSEGTAERQALMDGIYRYQRHIYDITRKYYLLGRDRMLAELAPSEEGTVLEVGCGTGRNLIAAARRYPNARFYGIDISTAMLETASANVARAGFADRIKLAQGDATAFSTTECFGQDDFERVFFSYSLSMIPPWQQAIEAAAAHVAPGGRLHVVDFGRQERLPGFFKRVLRHWLAAFHVAPRDDLASILVEAAENHGGTARLDPLYRGYSVIGRIAFP